MPCVKSHYTNPKNVFSPKPLNPSPIREVACHGLEWHSGPCPTLTYTWLDLESNGLRDMPHEFELITCEKNCQFTPYWPYIKYMLKIEVTTYPKAQSMHGIEV